jgi:two-component system, NarL family, response regulator NreC
MDIKVLVVDDHPILRFGLRRTIDQHPNFTVVGEASTGAEALKLVAKLAPDLITMDVLLPDVNGIELTRQILAVLPSVKIVVFSSDATRSRVNEALQAGACGYIWKLSAAQEIIRAIEMVMTGRLYLSPEVSADILEDYRKCLAGQSEPSKPFLSDREKQLLRFVAEGRRNKEIAAQLALSIKSIEAYRSRLIKKLGCSSTAELVRYAVREGIAAP